jgi:hypothetical protein
VKKITMSKRLFGVAMLAAMSVVAGVAHASVGWKLVKSASDSGEFASAYASGYVNRPISFKATVSAPYGADVNQSVDCDKGSRSIQRERGFHVLGKRTWMFKPTIAKPDECYASVSVSGDWDAGPQTVKADFYRHGGSRY